MNLRQKKSEIVNRTLCLGNIVQYDNKTVQEKTSFNGYVYHFSLYYANMLTHIG